MQKKSDLFFQTIKGVVPAHDDDITEFVNHFKLIHLKTDDFFVKEGSVCQSIGFVVKGLIRHYYVNESEETTRWMSVDGDFITALGSFIMQKPVNHNVQAIAPCEVLVISKSEFDNIYRTSHLLQSLYVRLMEEICLDLEERIYTQLSSDAEKRYLYMMEKWPKLIEKVPQKYIASMMGIQPESLSRVRAKLAQQGIS